MTHVKNLLVRVQKKSESELQQRGASPGLVRGIGLPQAVALNMLDMIGVGPFITLPLVVVAMGGPQAMLGWVLGALLAVCDGLVWAELGAAMPQAGGSYIFLREIYTECAGSRAGRFVSFLYAWQLALSAPLSIASGCIGLAAYASYLFPALQQPLFFAGHMPVARFVLVAIAACWLAVALLHRRISSTGKIALFLSAGVAATLLWVLFAGATHFHPALAFSFPVGAFHLSPKFFLGLGAATLLATYDYWGYYNICFLGGEVRDPQRNIPRAVLLSIAIVAVLYLAMNVSVLGVIPWQQIVGASSTSSGASHNLSTSVIAVFIERIYGGDAGRWMAVLILWTAFASIFSLLLGYSRVFYAAALDGNFFPQFARLHPRHRVPHVALVWLGVVASLACFFRLLDVIAALVVLRLLLQFLLQQVGLLLLRRRRPELFASFRMKLYPLPVWVAIVGSVFMLLARHGAARQMVLSAVVAVAAALVFWLRPARTASPGSGSI